MHFIYGFHKLKVKRRKLFFTKSYLDPKNNIIQNLEQGNANLVD